MGRLTVISPPLSVFSGRRRLTAAEAGDDGLELLGLEPELLSVTVAGETRGVADRLIDGEGRADRRPALELVAAIMALAAAAATLMTPPAVPARTALGTGGRPGEMVLQLL